MTIIAGVDEAGRGPLAGPVYAAAVVLNPCYVIQGLKDSKKLSKNKRQQLESEIKIRAKAWAVSYATVKEIDTLNILRASLLAMKRAVEKLDIRLQQVLVDGNQAPSLDYPVTTVIRGDTLYAEISAASILAKQARDKEMLRLGNEWPQYQFHKHKGYPTKLHLETLQVFGACKHHRKSFAPVARICLQNDNPKLV